MHIVPHKKKSTHIVTLLGEKKTHICNKNIISRERWNIYNEEKNKGQ